MDHHHHHSHEHGAHAHGHSHGHSHQSTAEHNAEYFDKQAEKYESAPYARELMASIGSATRAVLKSLNPNGVSLVNVLDFACGVGMLSRELAPAVHSITGVDISAGSVGVYNRKAAAAGAADKMHAIALDLKGTPGELDDKRFDAAVCSMAYHHFDSPEQYTKVLAHYLKPGGVLIVADLMNWPQGRKGPEVPEALQAAVPHQHGFSEEAMRAMFEGAGLVDIQYGKSFRMPMPIPDSDLSEEERMADVFLAHATKPKL